MIMWPSVTIENIKKKAFFWLFFGVFYFGYFLGSHFLGSHFLGGIFLGIFFGGRFFAVNKIEYCCKRCFPIKLA